MSEVYRRLRILEEKLRPAREVEPIRRDRVVESDEALALWRVLFAAGGRELLSDVYLADQGDEPYLAILLALVESEELVDEAERIARGGAA